jgi:hypothetical protein
VKKRLLADTDSWLADRPAAIDTIDA